MDIISPTVEFIGTLLLVYVILVTGNPYAIGATLALIIATGGRVSGGHFNPAVTSTLVFANKFNKNMLLPYVIAQVLGGIIGYKLYKLG
jgi:aquaporin Z